MLSRRRLLVGSVVVVVALVSAAVGLTMAYRQRIGPQFPTSGGTPYAIGLDADGCPRPPGRVAFVDAPGQFVPPDPTEVILCTRVDLDGDGVPEPPGRVGAVEVPPLQRSLHGAAAVEFAALLNSLPDRNGTWREWQRRHSGLWPDAPWPSGAWDVEAECFSLLMYPATTISLVLRYADRDPVPLASTCHGWTDGTRTRFDNTYTPPHLDDTFVALYAAQSSAG